MTSIVRFRHPSHRFAVLTLLIFGLGCQGDRDDEMTAEVREEVVEEISGLMEAYGDAVATWDADAIDHFWGDFGGFVFAGDGVILGGHSEWSETLRQYEEQVDRWLRFEYHNMHVEALSKDAATATTEFETSRITIDGDTVNVRGAWTYVFRRSNGDWDVVHTNGTHVEF
ncbi:MAG: nuclear transport factor 2 family protein [Gemmatimonadetes bacterium]|nr:nuclear transport factor 2 family protein [Gemmatimonadota bacterium]